MENLFDILIILFIIYAFLSPFFKKKPAGKNQPEQPVEVGNESKPAEEKSSQEILREIEELFGYKIEEEEKEEEVLISEDEEFHSPVKKEKKVEENIQQFEKIETRTPTSISVAEKSHHYPEIQMYDYEGTIPEIEIDEFDYSKISEVNANEIEADSKQTYPENTFKIQLNDIDDFKRAFVYKEIFDTPIALRMRKIKWQRNIY